MNFAGEIEPIGKRLVVERCKSEDKTPGGLYLPDSAKAKPQVARVLAVSRKAASKGLREGDQVVISQYAGVEIGEFLIIEYKDVLGVLREGGIE